MESKISVSELRVLAGNFFDYLENVMDFKEIEITKSLYWTVSDPEKYDMENKPHAIDVGNLIDDLDFLKPAILDSEQAVIPNMTHFAAILDYIAYNTTFSVKDEI